MHSRMWRVSRWEIVARPSSLVARLCRRICVNRQNVRMMSVLSWQFSVHSRLPPAEPLRLLVRLPLAPRRLSLVARCSTRGPGLSRPVRRLSSDFGLPSSVRAKADPRRSVPPRADLGAAVGRPFFRKVQFRAVVQVEDRRTVVGAAASSSSSDWLTNFCCRSVGCATHFFRLL